MPSLLPVTSVTLGVRDIQGGGHRSCADTWAPGFNRWRGFVLAPYSQYRHSSEAPAVPWAFVGL